MSNLFDRLQPSIQVGATLEDDGLTPGYDLAYYTPKITAGKFVLYGARYCCNGDEARFLQKEFYEAVKNAAVGEIEFN